jgi:hypothetical protein
VLGTGRNLRCLDLHELGRHVRGGQRPVLLCRAVALRHEAAQLVVEAFEPGALALGRR